jgi:hypothetical protein
MKCENPFFPCEGKSNKIAIIIRLKDGDHQICEDCWNKLAETDAEWGEPLPEPYYGPFPQETQQPNAGASVKRVEPKLRKIRVL